MSIADLQKGSEKGVPGSRDIDRIEVLRGGIGLGKRELCRLSGVGIDSYYRVLRGERDFSVGELKLLGGVLGFRVLLVKGDIKSLEV